MTFYGGLYPTRKFNEDVALDFIRMFCGKEIGRGVSRTVYLDRSDSENVFKIEEDGFNNVREWDLWCDIGHTAAGKWLSPCRHLSPGGRILVMQRTLPVPAYMQPKKLPAWLADLKWENWGLNGKGKIVCHDYAGNHLNVAGSMKAGMVPCTW